MQKLGLAETYCLNVPGPAAFTASGVLVSNSAFYAHEYASRGKIGVSLVRNDEADDFDDAPERDDSRGRDGYGMRY